MQVSLKEPAAGKRARDVEWTRSRFCLGWGRKRKRERRRRYLRATGTVAVGVGLFETRSTGLLVSHNCQEQAVSLVFLPLALSVLPWSNCPSQIPNGITMKMKWPTLRDGGNGVYDEVELWDFVCICVSVCGCVSCVPFRGHPGDPSSIRIQQPGGFFRNREGSSYSSSSSGVWVELWVKRVVVVHKDHQSRSPSSQWFQRKRGWNTVDRERKNERKRVVDGDGGGRGLGYHIKQACRWLWISMSKSSVIYASSFILPNSFGEEWGRKYFSSSSELWSFLSSRGVRSLTHSLTCDSRPLR